MCIRDRAAAALENWPNFVSTSPGIAYAYLRHYRRHRKDICRKTQSWSDLATSMKLRGDNRLQETVMRYNVAIDAGAPDEFGRAV